MVLLDTPRGSDDQRHACGYCAGVTSFPGDPADRLIYATAVEYGCPLITKDRRLRDHRHPRWAALW